MPSFAAPTDAAAQVNTYPSSPPPPSRSLTCVADPVPQEAAQAAAEAAAALGVVKHESEVRVLPCFLYPNACSSNTDSRSVGVCRKPSER